MTTILLWFICSLAIVSVWVIACEMYRRHRRLP